jgi:hypothetical protein
MHQSWLLVIKQFFAVFGVYSNKELNNGSFLKEKERNAAFGARRR